MKKIYFLFLVFTAIINVMIAFPHEKSNHNLFTLMEVASASAAGEYECRCVKCPDEGYGCLYYDYSKNDNSGYINDPQRSHFCPGYGTRGWIEEHAVTAGVDCN